MTGVQTCALPILSKLKQVLFDAFGIQMKAMKVVGADGKELEINKDSGAPAVGDVVTSDDGEYLQNDGTTIVVKDGKIAEIKPAEKKNEPAKTDEERKVLAIQQHVLFKEVDKMVAEIEGVGLDNDQKKIIKNSLQKYRL